MTIDPWVEEVRVALALNGGVSLAVWMGGCAVELDRARRTPCESSPAAMASAATPGERGTYGALCDAFRRELVIDVMSGSSAGGINGALLAGAQCHQRVLGAGFLRNRWLTLGDFSKLLYPLSEARPTALMQGQYFTSQLQLTFDELLSTQPTTDAPVVIAALDVTTTDIAGRPLQFRDTWGGTIYAREHRARFRFRDEQDFTAANLAAAARASASFPLAFESFAVPTAPGQLADLGNRRWVVDGGLLDNAPIQAALELIPTRPASRQVRRFVCYLNGEPDDGQVNPLPTAGPGTDGVIGVVLNLPRNAPFADQLIALQDVERRSPYAHGAQMALLTADLAELTSTARSLLAAYRHRRRLRALQDLLTDPGDAKLVFEALRVAVRELPWLPATLATPADAWPWGFQAARRVHHLAIDIIRAALPRAQPADRAALLGARTSIDGRLEEIETALSGAEAAAARATLQAIAAGGDVDANIDALQEALADVPALLAPGIAATARDLFAVAAALGDQDGVPLATALFGEPAGGAAPSPEGLATFLARAVALEVVKRSFVDEIDVDDGQEIAFAQLTPDAPAPIFTAHPWTAPAPVSADLKLCGIILGHFGGFYRRSWRANDFMWGRLDAAARIVEMLVGPVRSVSLARTDEDQPWAHLARELAAGGTEQVALLEEALADLPAPEPTAIDLEVRLHNVLAADLSTLTGGKVTRMLCTRAAQFEVLCDELQHVVRELANDEQLGCSPADLGLAELDLTKRGDVLVAIAQLRAASQPLPKVLGRDSTVEATSDLAVRTIAHAGLVALGVARQATKAAAPLLALRSLLLPISGAASQHARDRLAFVVAFAAAALFLGARVASTEAGDAVDIEKLSVWGLLLALVALLVVAGTAVVPFVRARWGEKGGGHRATQWALCAALLATGGVAGALIAVLSGSLSVAHLVIAPGVDPPWWVMLLPIALGTGAAVVGPRPLTKVVGELTKPAWTPTVSLVLTVLAAVILTAWSVGPLADAASSGELWRQLTAALAIAALPLALVVVVLAPLLATKHDD